jgi:Mrp family chromosome partitioning ATPase/antitoxin (DNA-binding transcriptional repressor) of toxin-antitoxin stability system
MKAVGIFSTKGGTGKTTIAINLAYHLTKKGFKVGLLDADIDNSNFAQFVKFNEKVEVDQGKIIKLPIWEGIKVFSMSLLFGSKGVSMNEDRYVHVINDVMQYADWGDLDYIIVDLPPGSSNVWRAVLKIFSYVLAGDVIVTIPMTTDSLTKAIDIHSYYDIPIIAVVENMAYFKCDCNKVHHLFGEPQAEKVVNGAPVIKVPIIPSIYQNVIFSHESINTLVDLITKAEVKKTSFLKRVKEAVEKEIKETVVKVLATIIVKAQKEIDAREIASKHGLMEGKPFVLTVTDEGGEQTLARVVLRVKDGRLVVVTKQVQPEFEIVASYRTFARIIMGKARINNVLVPYDPVDAWLKGDLTVYGVGAIPKVLEVLRGVFAESSFLEDVRRKFGTILEGWI